MNDNDLYIDASDMDDSIQSEEFWQLVNNTYDRLMQQFGYDRVEAYKEAFETAVEQLRRNRKQKVQPDIYKVKLEP